MPRNSGPTGDGENQPSVLTFYAQTHGQPTADEVLSQMSREPCEHCGTPISVLTIKLTDETVHRPVEVIDRGDGTVRFQSHEHDTTEVR